MILLQAMLQHFSGKKTVSTMITPVYILDGSSDVFLLSYFGIRLGQGELTPFPPGPARFSTEVSETTPSKLLQWFINIVAG